MTRACTWETKSAVNVTDNITIGQVGFAPDDCPNVSSSGGLVVVSYLFSLISLPLDNNGSSSSHQQPSFSSPCRQYRAFLHAERCPCCVQGMESDHLGSVAQCLWPARWAHPCHRRNNPIDTIGVMDGNVDTEGKALVGDIATSTNQQQKGVRSLPGWTRTMSTNLFVGRLVEQWSFT